MAKTNWGVWIVKAAACSVIAAGIFYYAGQQSVTFNEIVTTFASIPLIMVILVELVDKFVDMKDVYKQMFVIGQNQHPLLGYASVFGGAILAFLAIVWVLSGTLTMNVGSISPAILVVAGLITLYILAPETGDDEFILYLWIGATIATLGKYLTIIPSIPGLS